MGAARVNAFHLFNNNNKSTSISHFKLLSHTQTEKGLKQNNDNDNDCAGSAYHNNDSSTCRNTNRPSEKVSIEEAKEWTE